MKEWVEGGEAGEDTQDPLLQLELLQMYERLLLKERESAREIKEWVGSGKAGEPQGKKEALQLCELRLKEADERIKERLETIGVAEPAIDTQGTAASNKTSNRTTDEFL